MLPEPTKLLAAGLSVVLVAWLGVDTLWGLMDGWAAMATRAHKATTFEELRDAGEGFARVLGTDAARAMLLAVGALTGRTVGEVAARVRALPGYGLASAQWRAQGGAAVLGRVEVLAAKEGALARAVAAVETVAATPHGPLAVVMLKKGRGGGTSSGGGSSGTVAIRHRGGNLQVILPNGQRWHLPRGKAIHDIPVEDEAGDRLQKAVTEAAQQWTILDPVGNSRELSTVQWPGNIGPVVIEDLANYPPSTTALTWFAPDFAKRSRCTPEELKAVIEQFDCFVY